MVSGVPQGSSNVVHTLGLSLIMFENHLLAQCDPGAGMLHSLSALGSPSAGNYPNLEIWVVASPLKVVPEAATAQSLKQIP